MSDFFSFQNMLTGGLGQLDGSMLLPAAIIALLFMLALIIAKNVVVNHRSASKEAYALAKAQNRAVKLNSILTAVYRTVAKIPGLRKYLLTVEHAYVQICPYDDVVLMRNTSTTIAISFLISAVGIVAVLSLNLALEEVVTWYSIASCVLAVYLLSFETLNYRIRSKEKVLLEDLIHYFANVKHVYLAKPNIPQAILDAADGMSYEINMHAMQLHDILSGTDRKEKVREYALDPRTNPYLKMFISQAYEASEQGDTMAQGSDASLFTANLEVLRVEMMRDSCKKENKEAKFQGYSFVTCIPVFFMALMKYWGKDFSEEMVDFYNGAGYLVLFLSFFSTVLIYDNLNKAKDINLIKTTKDTDFFDRLPHGNLIKKYMDLIEIQHSEKLQKIKTMLIETGTNRTLGAFIARVTVYMIAGTLLGAVFFSVFHVQERERLLTEVNNIDNIVYVVSDKQKQVIIGHILDMTKDYLNKEEISLEVLQYDFNNRMFLPNQESVQKICTEVQRRVNAYHNEYLQWHEFVLSLLFGIAFGYIPILSLNYKYSIVQAGKYDEIRQFQSIIIMERLFPDVSTQQILEEMETFAVVFRKSIRKCINSYSAGPTEALMELRDSESECREFAEIVDGFLAVETVGVAKAFAEVLNNREMSESSRAIYEDILLNKKLDVTDLISFIPGAIVAIGYFIGPFCYYVLGSTMEMFDMLETFQKY